MVKQLTKEQHKEIYSWLISKLGINGSYSFVHELFIEDFTPACCDECSEGHKCEGEVKEILSRNESEFDSNIIGNAKPIADVIGTKKDA